MPGEYDPKLLRTNAELALDVHRRVLARRMDQSGRTRKQIRAELGWGENRLLQLLNRIGPMDYEDLFAVLEVIGTSRETYFEEICGEIAAVEGSRARQAQETR